MAYLAGASGAHAGLEHPRRRQVRFQDAPDSEDEHDDRAGRHHDGGLALANGRDSAPRRKSALRYMASVPDSADDAAASATAGDADSASADTDDAGPYIVKGIKPAFKLKTRRTGRRTGSASAAAVDPSADFVKAQFIWAHKSDNLALMEEALAAYSAEAPGGPLHRKITQEMIDETLMYAMLSSNLAMTRLLLARAGATVMGADAAHDRHKGDLSGCECGSHPGILLVTLARQGSLRMVELALEGGVDPDATVCDGESRSLWWGEGVSLQGLQLVRAPVLRSVFAKSSSLTAAATNNDLRMVRLLLRYGASMDACGWAVVAEAAWVRDPHHQLLSFLLGSLADSLNVYCDACSVALRAAASRGDEETLRWIIDRVDETEDWTSAAGAASAGIATGRAARRRRRRTLQAAQQQLEAAEHAAAHPAAAHPAAAAVAAGGLLARRPLSAGAVSARSLSDSSGATDGSCLNAASMRDFRGRRQSLVAKPGPAGRPASSDLGAARALSARHSSGSSGTASSTSSSSGLGDSSGSMHATRRPSKVSLSRILRGGGSGSSSKAPPVAADDLVSFAVAKAVDGLIAEALEPGYVHRQSFARGLEALAQIEQARVGAPVSLQARALDLYRIFIDTLAQGLPGASQDSALTLLHCGVEGFLDLGLTARGNAGSPSRAARAKAARALAAAAKKSAAAAQAAQAPGDATGGAQLAGSGHPQAAQRGAWDKLSCSVGRVAALPVRPLSAALRARQQRLGSSAAAAAANAGPSLWARRASLDEQVKALSVAVEGGHALVVRHLLAAARKDMHVVVPRLLAVAARANHPELLPVLLTFFPRSDQVRAMAAEERSSLGLGGGAAQDADAEEAQAADGCDGALREALNNALLVALENHADDFASALLEHGAKPSRALVVSALKHACQDPEYPDSAADFLLRLRAAADVQLTSRDVREVVDAVLEADEPNLYVFASVMDLDMSFRKAVLPQHLSALARAASRGPHLADWGDLLLMLLRCLEDHPDVEEAVQEAYNAAVNVDPTHPGVLHILMDRAMQNEDDTERWV